MAGQLRNLKGYRGPMVGLEVEAWASWLVTGADDDEDEASPRTIRMVARHLRGTTGLPFRAIIDDEDDPSPSPTERLPTSSPSNPIWAVRSDYSLDPLAAPDSLYGVGIEVITPPLEPTLADHAGRLLAERMLADEDFLPGMAAGVHVNVSVPGLTAADSPSLVPLDPFRGEASDSRLEEFGDPFFDTVLECLAAGSSSPDDVPVLVGGLVRRNRGKYLTNVLPLLLGLGYVELRHLGSPEFFGNPARAARLASKCVCLLAAIPKARVQSRMRDVISCAGRLRELGGETLTEAAAEAGRMLAAEVDDWGIYGGARQGLLLEVLRAVQKDQNLLRRFPWARGFPDWRRTRPRQRNRTRSVYAVACVDREELAQKMSAMS
jgi:hypothetical protein